ncbi:MAG: phosphoenolpyruvate--protein phosphotransferase [Acidobacteria bacterium]|nr:phosphoenolpyruvate--protein phosphotransferase [Acidobacteriota bacterium]
MPGSSNPAELHFVCPLVHGLHARPASQLAEFVAGFVSEFYLTNPRSGAEANLKSPLAIIASDIREGDRCSVRVLGDDQEMAAAALREFIAQELANTDESEVTSPSDPSPLVLPRALQSPAVTRYSGVAVSPGIGKGKAVVVGRLSWSLPVNGKATEGSEKEQERVEHAIAMVRDRLKALLSRAMSPAETSVLKAHVSILEDISFEERLAGFVAGGQSAAQAVISTATFFVSLLEASESAYIRERAIDIKEICLRLLEEIDGCTSDRAEVMLEEPSVVVAETLAPQQLLELERKWLSGLVLEYAGTTSHAVILARSLGIPTIVGVKDAPVRLTPGEQIVVDANRGLVVPNGSALVHRFYERQRQTQRERQRALSRYARAKAITTDGRRIEVDANICSGEESAAAFAQGAEAIGLFRTEFLFLGRDRAPSEEEQFTAYAQAAHGAKRRITIRTIDVGGDKPVPLLNLPAESNPYLGYRGMRVYQEHRDLFRSQLRAILRASALGRMQVMAPMVTTVEEVLWLKEQIAELQEDLERRSIAFDPLLPVGIMIEVPSVAFNLDQFSAEVDFFSIGTNDLNQYFMAVDRDNARVAKLASVRQPSFLRFLKHIVDAVERNGKWVGMCGEMASDVRNLPLLIGLGLHEISVPPPHIPALKRSISRFAFEECRQLLLEAIECARLDDVEQLLRNFPAREPVQPLFDPQLIILHSDSRTKEEAIRELIDSLYVASRTENPDRLEALVWAREQACTTGLGHGFAIPHCRTDAVVANSVAILKLSHPIEWSAVDEKPVSTVILLAVRESDTSNTHLQVLAKLARRLMNPRFREDVTRLSQSAELVAHLSRELEIPG